MKTAFTAGNVDLAEHPAEWFSAVADGKPYYYTRDGRTSWERPAHVAESDGSGGALEAPPAMGGAVAPRFAALPDCTPESHASLRNCRPSLSLSCSARPISVEGKAEAKEAKADSASQREAARQLTGRIASVMAAIYKPRERRKKERKARQDAERALWEAEREKLEAIPPRPFPAVAYAGGAAAGRDVKAKF